ncbi:9698_t:CDS:2 [Acaulospora morrowiae]|uniref:9698_t:CDS:1 n=1 Tax=Acaulospora morrowiae TaxID=94023 RepID=A0A9N9AZI7_9GLOM|nr:9698_t:CDS:2 [Acaulospora morrowiae]
MENLNLKHRVILGYPDLNNSGVRVVSGVEERCITDFDTHIYKYNDSNNDNDDASCIIPLNVTNTEDVEYLTSFLAINKLPPPTKTTLFINSLITLFCMHEVSEVIIVASLNFSEREEFVYLGCLSRIIKTLSPTAKLQDHFFNTFITLLKVEYIQTRCLLYPGKRTDGRHASDNSYEIGILKHLVEGLKKLLRDDSIISMDKVLNTTLPPQKLAEKEPEEKERFDTIYM